MRDPNRLYPAYDKIRNVHMENFPDERIGQFMLNFLGYVGTKIDPFFPEEDRLLELLDEYVEARKNPPQKVTNDNKDPGNH